jgi:glycosyltransferase involved in cell wall biosynthesis
MAKQLKVAFITSLDPLNRRSWSGTYYSMLMAINRHWGEAHCLGPIDTKRFLLEKIFNKIVQKVFHKKYNYQHSILYSMRYARIFRKKLERGHFDLIFAPAAAMEIACLKTQIPIIYASDATFKTVVDYYSVYSNLLGISIAEGNWIERAALRKARIVMESSEWAKDSAITDYNIDAQKIFTVSMGPNVDNIPSPEEILTNKKTNVCRLLLLGVDWERKGGSIAFDTLLHLEKMGIDAELTICGCVPPAAFSHKKMKVIPFLDKHNEQQYLALKNLFLHTDFLLLPTRAEGSGMVLGEGNAFCIPAITTNTGGVASTVTNGENGYMLPFAATGIDYAELIADIFRDDERYYALAKSSRAAYDRRLNWDAWALKGRKIINDMLGI